MPDFVERAARFINEQATGHPGAYTMGPGAQPSVYASCFAALALHTISHLSKLPPATRVAWCNYINSWQDPESGYYAAPELTPAELSRPELDETYVKLHLLVHVLPALDVLGGAPTYPLRFAHQLADLNILSNWLKARDWAQAWREGNNLLFIGQLLVYLRDREQVPAAKAALDFYFDWLDSEQDPATGLWGTNGYCDPRSALYGGYHQLLVYYYCQRPILHAERIIDTVLSLQQADGSFSRTPGGGACEDLDAVDVLVNLVKRTGYRVSDVKHTLQATLPHILRQQAADGGFVYRWGRSYQQSGILRTFVPPDTPDLFSTWFRLHTLALINELLDEQRLNNVVWHFNPALSMGWHDTALKQPAAETRRVQPAVPSLHPKPKLRTPLRRNAGKLSAKLLKRLAPRPILRLTRMLLFRYVRTLSPETALQLLIQLEQSVDELGKERSYVVGQGLHVPFWWSQHYRYFVQKIPSDANVLHLGCGSGSLSYTLANLKNVPVVATSRDNTQLHTASSHFHHPHLCFVCSDEASKLSEPPHLILLTDFAGEQPAWDAWTACWNAYPAADVIVQLIPAPQKWQDLAATAFNNWSQHQKAYRSVVERWIPATLRIEAIEAQWGCIFAHLQPMTNQKELTGGK